MVYICWASHALQGRKQKEAIVQTKAKLKKPSKFGLQAVTRLHEVGIVSNRESSRHGE